jgi:SH3-like domain-containing protein
VQRQELVHHRGAIIMGSAVNIKSTPAQNGTDLFILHEGTRVDIIDDQMQQWKQVRVADGKEGWVEAKQIEAI